MRPSYSTLVVGLSDIQTVPQHLRKDRRQRDNSELTKPDFLSLYYTTSSPKPIKYSPEVGRLSLYFNDCHSKMEELKSAFYGD